MNTCQSLVAGALKKEHSAESRNKEVIKISFMMPSTENSCVI